MEFKPEIPQINFDLLSDNVQLTDIYSIIRARNGYITFDNMYYDRIPTAAKVYLTCEQNHCWSATIADINNWCTVCQLLDIMNKIDPGIVYTQDNFIFGQVKFEFMCSSGHRFVTDERGGTRGCRSCVILKNIRRKKNATFTITMDTYCVNYNIDARLRFHCNALRHDPKCLNENCVDIRNGYIVSKYKYWPECKNFIPCNQDFYATTTKLNSCVQIYSCADNHTWEHNWEIVSTVRIFETYFDARFDDSDFYLDDVIMTGYNRDLAIAFTHGSDRRAAKCRNHAQTWCDKHNVVFIYIAHDLTKASKMTTEIVKQLIKNNICKGLQDPTVQKIRTQMKKMNKNHKLFVDRCVPYFT